MQHTDIDCFIDKSSLAHLPERFYFFSFSSHLSYIPQAAVWLGYGLEENTKQRNVEVERCMCGLCTPFPPSTGHASLPCCKPRKLLPSHCRLATVAANEQTPRRMLPTLLQPSSPDAGMVQQKKKDIVELAKKKKWQNGVCSGGRKMPLTQTQNSRHQNSPKKTTWATCSNLQIHIEQN